MSTFNIIEYRGLVKVKLAELAFCVNVMLYYGDLLLSPCGSAHKLVYLDTLTSASSRVVFVGLSC
jgi:hypothetical protein